MPWTGAGALLVAPTLLPARDSSQDSWSESVLPEQIVLLIQRLSIVSEVRFLRLGQNERVLPQKAPGVRSRGLLRSTSHALSDDMRKDRWLSQAVCSTVGPDSPRPLLLS